MVLAEYFMDVERNDFPLKNLVPFRSVPGFSEMELVPFQFHRNWNEFRNDSFRRFVTNNIERGWGQVGSSHLNEKFSFE